MSDFDTEKKYGEMLFNQTIATPLTKYQALKLAAILMANDNDEDKTATALFTLAEEILQKDIDLLPKIF